MKTTAAVLHEINKPLVIEELEIPKLKRGQVLVRMLATGVCRAQYNEMVGLKGPDKYLPHLLGHEGTAEVVEVGGGVRKFKSGSYVVCSWIEGEGLYGGTTVYKIGKNKINAGDITTFSTYSVISENRLTEISRKVPADIASTLGCAVMTGVGIVRNTLKVNPGSSIAIFGVGGVGSSALLGAKMKLCNPIIAVDIGKEKLKYAKYLGATHVIDALKTDPFLEIRKIVHRGVDYAIEASGAKSAMEKAFQSLNDHGKLAIAGNLKKGETISIVPYDLIKGKQITGTWGGESKPDVDIPYYVKEYLRGNLDLEKLVTKRIALRDVNSALKSLGKNGTLGRIVVVL